MQITQGATYELQNQKPLSKIVPSQKHDASLLPDNVLVGAAGRSLADIQRDEEARAAARAAAQSITADVKTAAPGRAGHWGATSGPPLKAGQLPFLRTCCIRITNVRLKYGVLSNKWAMRSILYKKHVQLDTSLCDRFTVETARPPMTIFRCSQQQSCAASCSICSVCTHMMTLLYKTSKTFPICSKHLFNLQYWCLQGVSPLSSRFRRKRSVQGRAWLSSSSLKVQLAASHSGLPDPLGPILMLQVKKSSVDSRLAIALGYAGNAVLNGQWE